MSEVRTIQIAGYRASVAIDQADNPQAPTILALHGFTGCGQDFLPLRQSLGARAAHWICPDFMGHGESDSPSVLDPYLVPATVNLIEQARQMAPDPGRVILLAYSMGGRLAMHYLLRAQPLPAVLIGTSPGLATAGERTNRRRADRKWVRLLSGPNPQNAFSTAWERQSLIVPQTQLSEPLRSMIAQRRRNNNPVGLIHSLMAAGTGALPSLWDKLDRLPQLILGFGVADRKFGEVAAEMAGLNPHFRLAEIPGAGHAPHLERPSAVCRLLEEQLASIAVH